MSSHRSWGAHGPLVLGVVVSAALLSAVWFTRRTVDSARAGAERGVGDGFAIAAQEQLRRPQRPDAAALATFLAEQEDEGLRYVAVARDGKITAAQGEPVGAQLEPGLYRVGDRIRLVQDSGPARGRRSRTPAGRAEGNTVMIYEFDPLVADQLGADARSLTWAAVIAAAVVMGLAFWVTRGVRARERMQRELEQRRRLAALGEMSAVLAHELRNPLASLKGHAQLLVEMLEDPGELPAARAKAGRVVDESLALQALTDDLLEFVRTGEIHRAEVDPAALVRAAAIDVDADRIEVDADSAPRTWPLDETRLRAALVNVLRNAVQVSERAVTATVRATGGALVIEVRDRGPGIPAGEEEQVFEPFHTRRVKGVGLGLAIARRVVEAHGGAITAANHPDGGAVFRFRLPRSA
jgi:two-component system sensor histidine kinase HydH